MFKSRTLLNIAFLVSIMLLAGCSQSSNNCKQQKGVVMHKDLNVLYAGLANNLTVSVPGYCSEKISAELSKGNLEQNGPGSFTARVSDTGQTDLKINVQQNSSEAQPIDTITYQVDSLPLPYPEFSGKSSGHLKLPKASSTNKVTLKKPAGFPMPDAEFELAKYRITFVPREGKFQDTVVKNTPQIPEKMDSVLNEAERKSKLIFDAIQVQAPSGQRSLKRTIVLTLGQRQEK